jgi:hypothetical protein
MNKVILLLIIIIIILAVVGAVGFYVFQNVSVQNHPAENNSNENIVGGDADQHGCLASAGYMWCQQKQKCLRVFEEFCPSEAEDLVKSIKDSTGIELVFIGDKTFKWNTSEGTNFTTTDIAGVQYKVENIKQADYQKVENYIKNNYEQNIGNMADGVVGGERGYIVNYMACVLNFIHTEMINNPGTPSVPANDILNATLSCGFYNKNFIK